MKRLWRYIKFVLKSLLILLVLAGLFAGLVFWRTPIEDRLVETVAREKIAAIKQSVEERRQVGLPEGIVIQDDEPDDTNALGGFWEFWYECEPRGSLLLYFEARRRILLFPLFNRKQDIKLIRAAYVP